MGEEERIVIRLALRIMEHWGQEAADYLHDQLAIEGNEDAQAWLVIGLYDRELN